MKSIKFEIFLEKYENFVDFVKNGDNFGKVKNGFRGRVLEKHGFLGLFDRNCSGDSRVKSSRKG
jgi:hypothetical protein